MPGPRDAARQFFISLCESYYPKILRYTHFMLENEAAARDCTQEVFLLACQKSALLAEHPNPGGFLFQTAKNLVHKARRERYERMLHDLSLDDAAEPADTREEPLTVLDREIDVIPYWEQAIERLSEEKRLLYRLYYIENRPMAQIAPLLSLSETALRMRYVRLRRELREIVSDISEQNFIS